MSAEDATMPAGEAKITPIAPAKEVAPKPKSSSRHLLAVGALVALAGVGAVLFFARPGGLHVDNAFVAGHVTRLVSPETGTIDVLGLTPHVRAERGAVAFVVNRGEHELAIEAAVVQLRAAVRDELQQCVLKKSWDYRSALARATHERAARKLTQTSVLAKRSLVAEEELRDAQFDDQQTELSHQLARLEARRMQYGIHLSPATRHDVAVAINALHAALTQRERATIRVAAPSYVFDVFVSRGQRVEQGSPLGVLVPEEPLTIQANLLESQLSLVQVGQRAQVRVDSNPRLGTLHGYVTSIVPAAAAAFSPVPRGNVDSTWVKVSQRVPVFIAVSDDVPVAERPPIGTSSEVVLAADAVPTPALAAAPAHAVLEEERRTAELQSLLDRVVELELKLGAPLSQLDAQCRQQLRAANWKVNHGL
jgi:membrane fusion protein (multidrug efflux system)